jgi:hypothetical protein
MKLKLLALACCVLISCAKSKKQQFFESCHQSNEAMLEVFGKNADPESGCGKCWKGSLEKMAGEIGGSSRLKTLMMSCPDADPCGTSNGMMDCECVASKVQSEDCFELYAKTFSMMGSPCKDICKNQ